MSQPRDIHDQPGPLPGETGADDVIAWLASMGVDAAALTSDERRQWVADLTDPAGPARTDYAAWLAARGESGGAK